MVIWMKRRHENINYTTFVHKCRPIWLLLVIHHRVSGSELPTWPLKAIRVKPAVTGISQLPDICTNNFVTTPISQILNQTWIISTLVKDIIIIMSRKLRGRIHKHFTFTSPNNCVNISRVHQKFDMLFVCIRTMTILLQVYIVCLLNFWIALYNSSSTKTWISRETGAVMIYSLK